ncbi:MAG TPA: Uma2 family endonuclease [Armatimonadota bacterium]|nr:Uma2 family endonuclease [Armatimonadota bacterium]
MAEPALQPRPMTLEEAALLDPDQYPGEVVEGEWVPVSRNTWRHGMIAGNAYALLRHYARQHGGWSVAVGDPGTRLARNPDTLRGPDVAIVREERQPTGKGVEGWLDGAPDVAVEIVGDGQTASELARKALEYLAAGAKWVWVLDPGPRLLMLFTPPSGVRILGPDDMLDGGDVLPGFACRVAEFFE